MYGKILLYATSSICGLLKGWNIWVPKAPERVQSRDKMAPPSFIRTDPLSTDRVGEEAYDMQLRFPERLENGLNR